MHSTSGRHTGLLYLAPALVFVAVFTAFPVIQMLWMSLHNWSLIEPPKWVGFANYVKAYKDSQFWTSLRFTLTYTLYITPILMVGGFLIALFFISQWLDLETVNWVIRNLATYVVFAIIVLFQADIRRALAHFGRAQFFKYFERSSSDDETVEELVVAHAEPAAE